MSAISHQVPRSGTSIYGGIVAAVTTVAVSVILFRKLWETGNRSRDKGISKQGHANTSQLQDALDKTISIPAQVSTTSRPNGDIGSEEVRVPSITLSQGPSNFQISKTNAIIIRNNDGQFTKIQRNLVYDYMTNLIVLPKIDYNMKKHVLTQSIITLPRVEAVFNDYQNRKKEPCFTEGTTVALLREMADCVTGSSECRMYILSGTAGIGKSTVAYTIASRAADLNLLGASFCFSRDDVDRNNAKKFFTTIAYQLCVYNETFSKAIGDVLETERGSAATKEDPQNQLLFLILAPLRSIVQSHSRPTLIVVDALDECDAKDAISVLTGLSQLVRCLPSFKVILTTRHQPYLDRFLTSHGGHTFIHLQDIENMVVNDDIRLYLNHRLSLEQVQMRFPERQWRASDEEIDSLVHAMERPFIIASTAVRYILDKSAANPAAQMQKLLRAFAQHRAPFKDLDHFYTVILRNILLENCDDDGLVSRYKTVVGTIIFVQRPFPVSALSHLIDINVAEIHAVLDKLQSVVLLGGDDVPRVYHLSFPDYLTDQARCKVPHLQIDPRICHTQIATRCFEIMDKYFRRNILDLGDLARFLSNEDGFKEDGITDEQLEEKIPQQLRYACIFWANHLEAADTEDADLMNVLEKFLAEHMLHWFEVLSLVGKLDSAHVAIIVALKLLKPFVDLHQLLLDALHFISKFHEIIKRSALHTYYSALSFTPTDSLLYHRYNKEIVHNTCNIEGGPEKWDGLASLGHGEPVDVVKFSPDSSLLVSSSKEAGIYKQGKLKIWDAGTGTPICTVPGHKFAIANDFSTVASSQDNIAMLHNVDGSPIVTIFTTSKIENLALSYESSRVAAALADGTVWLWESRSTELIDCFDGYESSRWWPLLKFSPTGTRLAYSSTNGVKLRDGISRSFIADLRCGPKHQLEFSGDGSRIVVLTFSDISMWDSESGGLIAAVRNIDHYRLAIPADGSLFATADDDKVTLWSRNNDSLAQIAALPLKRTWSMAFSLDNILAISTEYDLYLYNVKTRSFIHTLLPNGEPKALAFSPDCTRLATGGYDGSVGLWDIRGVDTSGPPSKETIPITLLALSRDCSRLACGFEDGRVELWETSPTKRRIVSHPVDWFSRSVRVLGFGPDGGLFASGSVDGTIKLWNGEDGSLHGTLKTPSGLGSVALSNSVLVAARHGGVTLWSLDTLSLIHTFTDSSYETPTVSISENNALIAVAHRRGISLLDAENHSTITTFDVLDGIHTMTFLPDNLQLVALSREGVLLSFNLLNKHIMKGATLEDLIRFLNISLWHGVPVWYDNDHHYFKALFSQHKSLVPVFWIPRHIRVTAWTQGSSMIALGCRDGRVILVRLPTSRVG